MDLTQAKFEDLREFRHRLHRRPELSGEEVETAETIVEALSLTGPDEIVTGIGGHGVAAVYVGRDAGPTVLLRCELDALPIKELTDLPYASEIDGKGHLCGHDGHMTTLAAVARALGRQRPQKGRVVLMFQPAEENGAGAAAVIADQKFAALKPDFSFSLHNMPGLPLGYVALIAGPVNCASRGMRIELTGKTAHASSPEDGLSPAPAAARLIAELPSLTDDRGSHVGPDFSLVTLTHARIGEPAFGIAPGHAEIWATLRTLQDDRMAALVHEAEDRARSIARSAGLDLAITYHDVFRHCENDETAVTHLKAAIDAEGIARDDGDGFLPMKGSEDFGLFGHVSQSAMFFLGAGENHPRLHNPDYDFPDELIDIGSRIFLRTIRTLLG
ncbi:amidohydrolase [Neorhizobium sp. NPDC001467]|uniref:amidohydrolase n=1 Tax=Neorhizobium sp. NPDC001467 TaxID=3390595 RepID=UPI003CFDBC71